jgi:UDP-N-acetylmuramoyl-L-alanyl-D-glutamate--2,6-diaminopimelate ligase
LSPSEVAAGFAVLASPPGRLEKVGGNNEPLIVVDYAHTPDALENSLCALREIARVRGAGLTVIFGCGGDRDQGKRPLMGAVATQFADRVVLTSDNPRSEDAAVILEQIRAGAPAAQVIADRATAIRQTIAKAHPAEVLLIAGKGHESYQEIAGIRCPFSDLAEARAALAARREVGQQ